MRKQRIAWVDNIKAFLILLVVLGHCIQDAGKSDISVLYSFIYSFHIPLFMAMSGYVSQRDFTPWRTVGRRAVQLLVPFFAWAVVKSLIVGDLGFVLTIVMLPDRGLWFLWALFFMVLIIKCCDVVARRLQINIVVTLVAAMCMLYLLALIMGIRVLGLQFVAWQMPFYCFGRWLNRCNVAERLSVAAMWMLFGAFALMLCFYPLEGGFGNVALNKLAHWGYAIVVAATAIVAFVKLFSCYFTRNFALGDALGQNTLAIYAISLTTNIVYIKVYGEMVKYLPDYMVIAALFVGMVAYSWVVMKLLDLTKITSLLFLGKNKWR